MPKKHSGGLGFFSSFMPSFFLSPSPPASIIDVTDMELGMVNSLIKLCGGHLESMGKRGTHQIVIYKEDKKNGS